MSKQRRILVIAASAAALTVGLGSSLLAIKYMTVNHGRFSTPPNACSLIGDDFTFISKYSPRVKHQKTGYSDRCEVIIRREGQGDLSALTVNAMVHDDWFADCPAGASTGIRDAARMLSGSPVPNIGDEAYYFASNSMMQVRVSNLILQLEGFNLYLYAGMTPEAAHQAVLTLAKETTDRLPKA